MRVVAMAFTGIMFWLSLAVAVLLAILSGWFWWLSYACSLLLLFALYLTVVRVPLLLNWSKNLYPSVVRGIIAFQLVAILTYAIVYFQSRAIVSGLDSFEDALYFSATTWTTLGYGDIKPPIRLRLITSVEALTGLTTLPVIASIIWMYCQNRLWNKSADAVGRDDLSMRFDDTIGAFVDLPEEKARYQESIMRRIKINSCNNCNSDNIAVERHFDVMGRTLPLIKIVIRCEDCGQFTKPRTNAYLAAWSWNKHKRA